MIKLHLGCGGSMYGVVQGIDGPQFGGTVNDWINVDANPDQEMLARPGANDLVGGFTRVCRADMRELPFPGNFADVAYSHHSLEHVRVDEVVSTLKEWYRVLRPGGLVFINAPDLLWVAERLIETDGDLLWSEMGQRTGDFEGGYTKLIHCIFGDQSNNTYQIHKTGFTQKSLRQLLVQAGFHNVLTRSVGDMGMFCVEAEGIK